MDNSNSIPGGGSFEFSLATICTRNIMWWYNRKIVFSLMLINIIRTAYISMFEFNRNNFLLLYSKTKWADSMSYFNSCNGFWTIFPEPPNQVINTEHQIRDRKKIFRNSQKFLYPSVLHTSDSYELIAKKFFRNSCGKFKIIDPKKILHI